MEASIPRQKQSRPTPMSLPELECALSSISLPKYSSCRASLSHFAQLRGWMHQCLVVHRSPQTFISCLRDTQCNPQEQVIVGLLKACCSNDYRTFVRREWARVNVIYPEEPPTTSLLAVAISKVVSRSQVLFYFALKLALLLASRAYFRSSWLLFNSCLKGSRGKCFKASGISLLNLTLRTKTQFITTNIFSILRAVERCGFQLSQFSSLLWSSNQFQNCVANIRKVAQQERSNSSQSERIQLMLNAVCAALRIDFFHSKAIERRVDQDSQQISPSPKHSEATSLLQKISLSRTCTLEELQLLKPEWHAHFFTGLQSVIQRWVTEEADSAICGMLQLLLERRQMEESQVADIIVIGLQSMEAIERVAHWLNTHPQEASIVRDSLHKKLRRHSAILSLFLQ